MLYTKIQLQSFLGSREEDLCKSFYHIWAWRSSCSMAQNQIVNNVLTESRMWNLVIIAQAVSEKTFKNNMVAVIAFLDFGSAVLAIFDLEVILLLQWNFQLKSPNGSGGCQKLVIKMTAVAAILDFWSAKFYLLLIYKSFCCYNVSFNSNHQMVQKQTSKFALQYGGCGGHFGFPFHTILVTFTSTSWHITLS